MPPKQERSTLKDLINYQPETYISQEEINLIKYHFKGNDKLLGILRKMFLPTYSDIQLPIEEMGSDVWLTYDFAQMPAEHIKPIVLARQDAIKLVAGGLVKLKIMANAEDETPENRAQRRAKDSGK